MGSFFFLLNLFSTKNTAPSCYVTHFNVDSTTQNTPLVPTLPTHPGTLHILYYAPNNLYTAFVDGVDHVSSPDGLDRK